MATTDRSRRRHRHRSGAHRPEADVRPGRPQHARTVNTLREVPAATAPRPHDHQDAGVPLARLYALRAGYLFVVVGLAVTEGPSLVFYIN